MSSSPVGRRDFLRVVGGSVLASSSGLLSAESNKSANPRPNILFFFPDQHRYDWTGFNSELPVRTPYLDALAKRGTRFNRAVTPSPLCAPARACVAAGREYDRCRVPSNGQNYPLDQPTFYTMLRDSGYHVAGCGKFDLHKASQTWGLDGKGSLREWGFSDGIDSAGKLDAINAGSKEPKEPYMAYLESRGLRQAHIDDFRRRGKIGHGATFPTPLPDEAYCDNWIANNGLELMKRFPANTPWFLQVNFTGPHSPWDITERMEKTCRDRQFPQPNNSTQLSPEKHVAVRQNYTAMVENIDRLLGVYIERLKERGELDNTIIVYSSDHGEMLGDHDRWGKSLPWQPSVGVPLAIAAPGGRPGIVSDALVSILDLTATFLDYAQLPRPSDMDSLSLRPLIEGARASHRAHVLSGLGAWRVVMDDRYKLIAGFNPRPRGKKAQAEANSRPTAKPAPILYDLSRDPLENQNIAARFPDEVARLSILLPKRA